MGPAMGMSAFRRANNQELLRLLFHHQPPYGSHLPEGHFSRFGREVAWLQTASQTEPILFGNALPTPVSFGR